MVLNPVVDIYSLLAQKYENTPKNTKDNKLLKTKRILKIKM